MEMPEALRRAFRTTRRQAMNPEEIVLKSEPRGRGTRGPDQLGFFYGVFEWNQNEALSLRWDLAFV